MIHVGEDPGKPTSIKLCDLQRVCSKRWRSNGKEESNDVIKWIYAPVPPPFSMLKADNTQ